MREAGYGTKLDASRLEQLLDWVLRPGQHNLPLCIWGPHGIGKTTIVEDYARQKGWPVAYCAPAQFEEMGDFHGLPVLVSDGASSRTHFAVPSWVPTAKGPGILLLDDINRADDRILRGLMQLLQRHALLSWALPEGWRIVATANPERASYSVTPLDDAMLDRMLHVTLVFSAESWARWAMREGVDRRGVEFVLAYPEIITGRTTPRALARFFSMLRDIERLDNELDLVSALAHSALDEGTAAAFVRHAALELTVLLEADDILEAEPFEEIAVKIVSLVRDERGLRLDRLSILGQRLRARLTRPGYVPEPHHGRNLVQFLLLDVLPTDLRIAMHNDLCEGSAIVAGMLEDPRLALKLLGEM